MNEPKRQRVPASIQKSSGPSALGSIAFLHFFYLLVQDFVSVVSNVVCEHGMTGWNCYCVYLSDQGPGNHLDTSNYIWDQAITDDRGPLPARSEQAGRQQRSKSLQTKTDYLKYGVHSMLRGDKKIKIVENESIFVQKVKPRAA